MRRRIEGGPRGGTALTAALVVVMSIAAMGAFLIQTQASMARRQSQSIDTRTALYTAEAGIAEAAFQLSQGKSGEIGSAGEPAEFNGNRYWVEAEEGEAGLVSLTSTGLAGRSRFRVNVVLRPNENPVARLGLFGDEGVAIGDRVVVDGYDAEAGTLSDQRNPSYDFWTTGGGGLVSSNGDIVIDDGVLADDPLVGALDGLVLGLPVLKNVNKLLADAGKLVKERYDWGTSGVWPDRTLVFGRALAGTTGVVLKSPAARIAEMGSREADVILPDVLIPQDLESMGVGVREVTGKVQVKDRAVAAEGIIVREGAELKLVGPLMVHVGQLTVEGGATLLLDDDKGSITIYCSTGLDFRPGSFLRTQKEDEKSMGSSFLVARSADPLDDQRVVLDCLGSFRGVIYAPGDHVSIPAGFRVLGSVVAKHLTLEDGAWVTVDESLKVGGTGFPSLPKLIRWSAPPVGPGEVAAAGAVARPAAELTPEQEVEVVYVDHADSPATYSGDLASFDATLAERILALRWLDPDTMTYSDWDVPPGTSPEKVIARWRDKLRAARDAAEAP